MASPQPSAPPVATGLPPGVETGPLGKRLLAHVIDSALPAVATGVAVGLVAGNRSGGALVITIICAVLTVGWALVVWWMFAVKAAGPGMRAMKLQLVGLADGRPIGWGRFFLRQLVLFGLSLTGIGLVVMLVLLVQHQRKQGWHDLLAQSVVIKERALAPVRPKAALQQQAAPSNYSTQGPTSPAPTYPTPASQPSSAPSAPAPGAGSVSYGPAGTPYGASAPSAPYADPGEASRQDQDQRPAPSTTPEQPPAPAPLQPPEGMGATDPAASSVANGGPPSSTAAPNPPYTQFPAAPPPPVSESESSPGSTAAPAAPASSAPSEARPMDQGWVAALDEGREIDISGLVLLGRNPQPRPGEEEAELIKVADETRTVSKSHLGLGADANGMWVMDRGSTNGSTVTNSSGVSRPCPPGTVVQVAEGNIVSFGDHWLEVRRRH